MTPREELIEGNRHAKYFWEEVHRLAPQAECVQKWGNHDARATRRILEASPEHEDFVVKGVRELYEFPGVLTVEDASEETEIEGTPGNS